MFPRPVRRLRALVLLTAAATALPAAAATADDYRVLPNLKVLLDDRPVEIGPAVQDAEAVLVPLDAAVEGLTRGRLSGEADAAAGVFRARDGGRVVLEIPLRVPAAAAGAEGEPSAFARVNGREVPLGDGPESVRLPGRPPRPMIDLKALAGLLGITADQDGDSFALYTPEFWAGRLNLGARAQERRTLRNLPLLPDLGVSPPAKSLVVWVRPREKSYVQIFKLSGPEPAPMLGEDNFGKRVTQPTPPFGVPKAWPAEEGRPVRVDTRFYDAGPPPGGGAAAAPRWAEYVALVSRKEPPGGDLAAAIREGKIGGEDWCVVGVRQRVARPVVLFEAYPVGREDTVAGIAAKFAMPPEMLLGLNGLRAGDALTVGERLVVVRGIDVGEQRRQKESEAFIPAGVYAVRPGDTVAGIARRCGVRPDDLLAANPSIPPGAELEPGELLTLVKPRPVPPRPDDPAPMPVPPPPSPKDPPVADVKTEFRIVRARRPVPLRQSVAPDSPVLQSLKAGQTLTLLATQPRLNLCRVDAGGAIGWVRLSDITTAPPQDTAPPPLPPPSPAEGAAGARVSQEALRWVGVPRYHMGGNDIRRSIDCSHFVAAVFALCRERVPSPPVHNMEVHGAVVHWRSGSAEQFGQVSSLPKSPPLAGLRPGDRVVFQNNPASQRQGNHHTGIYIGQYGQIRHAVVHCNAGRNTVSVDDLTGRLWRIYRYTVRGTGRRAAESVPFARAGSGPAPRRLVSAAAVPAPKPATGEVRR